MNNCRNIKLAIVGVTGMVGRNVLDVLDERRCNIPDIVAVASPASVGKKITFAGREHVVVDIETALTQRPDVAIFSAGKDVSTTYAPMFASAGTFVVDNSSAWRMNEHTKLIVPEVNIGELSPNDRLIANPNCSTIQLVAVLAPLHQRYGLKRVVVSTYQSVSGSGFKGVNQLMHERRGEPVDVPAYPHQIDLNCIPHGGNFLNNAYTDEEMKLVDETRKILQLPQLPITATVVRVPVVGGHSESVNIELQKNIDIDEVKQLLENSQGIVVQDDIRKNLYPMAINAHHKNEVFVGRIRRDFSVDNGLNLWIVADNLRKGAATNAVQIVEYVVKNFLKI